MSENVHIFEVGARDGLQNESRPISFANKVALVRSLVRAGIQDLELGAFVRPDRVPQMADTDQIYTLIQKHRLNLGKTQPWCLVPNREGLRRALRVGATHIAVFTAATESFAQRNIHMSIRESLAEFREVVKEGRAALGSRLKVRGYISTAFGCPFEGKVSPKKPLRVLEKLSEIQLDQISIADTIGVGTPREVEAVIRPALKMLGEKKIAVHFHDTRGTALANALRSLDLGVRTIDSSAGGLGGCPFAPGAAGNLATEDLVYMLHGMGIRTGVDLDVLARASLAFAKKIRRPLSSRFLQAFSSLLS